MRIGINCIHLEPADIGGVKSYSMGLLHAFARTKSEHRFILIVKHQNLAYFKAIKAFKNFEFLVYDESSLGQKIAWRVSGMFEHPNAKETYSKLHSLVFSDLRKQIEDKCDIVYTPTTTLFPYGLEIPTILSMHDILQVHYPQFFNSKELAYRKLHYSLSAGEANVLQASSDFIRDDLNAHFKMNGNSKVVTIPEGVDVDLFDKVSGKDDILRKYNIDSGYLYYPAQLWKHKDHICVLQAMRILKERGNPLKLVFTGEKGDQKQMITNFIEDNQINAIHLGNIDYNDVLALYKHAFAVISAALYESSSLTILEAAASGVPIVASDIEPYQEVSKDLSIHFFHKSDAQSLADTLDKMRNTDLGPEVINNKTSVKKYSWDKVANQYLELFENTIA